MAKSPSEQMAKQDTVTYAALHRSHDILYGMVRASSGLQDTY